MIAKQPYYSDHERAYREIRRRGEMGWQKKTIDTFRCHETEAKLRPILDRYFPNPSGKLALDLGCGSGSTAHFLDELGFRTKGIDISGSAIELAQELAQKFEKTIEFAVEDVLAVAETNRKYDLVYDSHCFHCIVLESDRRQALTSVKNSLSEEGLFILDTMAFRETADICLHPEPLMFDENYILWHEVGHDSNLDGVVERAGHFWCPQRRVYPAETILNELENVGLQIVESTLEDLGESRCYLLRAVCC